MLSFIYCFICCNWFLSTIALNPGIFRENYRNSSKVLQSKYATVNIILSSPHAGSAMPSDVPDRVMGGCRRLNSTQCTFFFNDSCSGGTRCPITTVQDFADFDRFAEDLAEELNETYGLTPFLIVAKWNRHKIDFNREINEATFNHPESIKSYNDYHMYLKEATDIIQKRFNGRGLLLDVHQHAQGNYSMVGMLLTGAQLNRDNLSRTSIEMLIERSCREDRQECIRGSKALGTFFELNGLGVAYPSLNNPKPENRTFYGGGFITKEYGSQINVIQTELSFVVRNEITLKIYAKTFTRALIDFMRTNDILVIKNGTKLPSAGTTTLFRYCVFVHTIVSLISHFFILK